MARRVRDPRLEVVPDRDADGRYVVSDEVGVDLSGYGRLLPLINVFRLDSRYDVHERDYSDSELARLRM
jgi:hypothetical protein